MRARCDPQPTPVIEFHPMPCKTLSDRFVETDVPPDVVRSICFGGCSALNVMSDAFMNHQHILITNRERAFVVPPGWGLGKALEMMERHD